MPQATVGDIEIYYEIQGQGDPLLLIMGLGGNLLDWGQTVPNALAESFQVILFDNRGAGRSGQPPGPYSMPQMAADAAGLLAHLDIASAHVFGVSMGGMIAQNLALDFPERVDKLVLGCTFCGGHQIVQAEPEVLQYLAPRPDLDPFEASWWGLPSCYTDAFIAQNGPLLTDYLRTKLQYPSRLHAYEAQLNAITDTHRAYPRLPEMGHQTLVLTGDADRLVPPANSDTLTARIPNATLRTIPGAAHVFWISHPDETVEIVREFLV